MSVKAIEVTNLRIAFDSTWTDANGTIHGLIGTEQSIAEVELPSSLARQIRRLVERETRKLYENVAGEMAFNGGTGRW